MPTSRRRAARPDSASAADSALSRRDLLGWPPALLSGARTAERDGLGQTRAVFPSARATLEDNRLHPQCILTVRGLGHEFAGYRPKRTIPKSGRPDAR